jgi:hypothetical protein
MRLRRTLIALSFTAAATLGTVGVAASPAQAASCPDNGWSILDGRVGRYFNGNYINIRSGPSTGCVALGQGQASHTVQLDCWKWGDGGTWSHLYDFTTGKEGWTRDDLLVGNGANVHC